MVDDPAWQWVGVLGRELVDHVAVPIAFIVPALMLAVYFATRRSLSPLTRIERQASVEFEGVVTGMNAMVAKLNHSLTLQKKFTSDVAHQLRTPLIVLLLQVSNLPAVVARDHLRQELSDLADLVNQLLQFAQAEDAMSHHRDAVDIVGSARKVCEDLAGAAFNVKKQIEFDAAAPRVIVSGHPVLIDVAIRNIVDNAIKLSPAHTTISVSIDAEHKVIVEDRGPGVPEDQKKRIFERFWRAEDHRGLGSGIGLALVRRIAFLHGGDVTVEDRPGGGARFVISLKPMAQLA